MNPIMAIKHGVQLEAIKPQAVLAAFVTYTVLANHGYDFVITSGRDGKHMAESLHYTGYAFDFRTNKILDSLRSRVFADLRESLGPEFDVVQEKDHGHVEWDPDYLKKKKV